MAEPSRYNINESGADIEEGILKNKLNVTDQAQLDDAETILLNDDGFEMYGNIVQLKFYAKDGKKYATECTDACN